MEFLRAVVEFLMSMGALHEVQNIYVWLQGSFVGQGYRTSVPVAGFLLISLPLQFYLGHRIELLRLSPGLSQSLGFHLAALRSLSVVMVAIFAALGASIGGPIAFIALAAPVLVRGVLKSHTSGIWCAGLAGAILLSLSDTLARVLADPVEIAAGVVTRVLGGAFFIFLLIRQGRR